MSVITTVMSTSTAATKTTLAMSVFMLSSERRLNCFYPNANNGMMYFSAPDLEIYFDMIFLKKKNRDYAWAWIKMLAMGACKSGLKT